MSARRSTLILSRFQETCQCGNRLSQRPLKRSAVSIPSIFSQPFSTTPGPHNQEAQTKDPTIVQKEPVLAFDLTRVHPVPRTRDHAYETEPRNAGYRRNIIERPQAVAHTRPRQIYKVNDSTEALDTMYQNLLGSDGHKLLSEDVKWQCVTHKSFDHAMQPFNEKLSFYGISTRRLILL